MFNHLLVERSMVEPSTNPTIVRRGRAPIYITLVRFFLVLGGCRLRFGKVLGVLGGGVLSTGGKSHCIQYYRRRFSGVASSSPSPPPLRGVGGTGTATAP